MQSEVSIDFIIKLPRSKDLLIEIKFDLILVIVDNLTKYIIIIVIKEINTIVQLAFIVLEKLIRDNRLLKVILSNSNRFFTLNYQRG